MTPAYMEDIMEDIRQKSVAPEFRASSYKDGAGQTLGENDQEKHQRTSIYSDPESSVAEPLPLYKPWELALIIGSLFFGTFLVALDATIVGTAVPSITTEFHSLDDIAWYGSGYLLTVTAFQPTFGKLYKLLSVKNTYMACVIAFEVGSIICAAAPSSTTFILGRAIAGSGAAGLLQGALVIITNSVSLEKRPLYISIVLSVFAVSAGIGPVIGGVFTEHLTWRWCFWINVPVGGAVLVILFFLLRMRKGTKQQSFKSATWSQKLKSLDPIGAVLIISSICCLLLALQWGGQSMPWNSSTVIGLFVGFGVLLGLFGWLQWRLGDEATLPFLILKQRSIFSGALFLFFFSMPTYTYGYYVPIYFQAIKGSGANESGIEFLTIALPTIVLVIISGALVTRFGIYVPYMIVGTAISIIGSGLITLLDVGTSTLNWAAFLVVCGVGTGLAINVPYTAVQVVLNESDVPTGNAVMQFLFQLGAALSLSIGQTVFLTKLESAAAEKTPQIPVDKLIAAGASQLGTIVKSIETLDLLQEVYAEAIQQTFLFALVAACLAFLLSLWMEHRNIKSAVQERKQGHD